MKKQILSTFMFLAFLCCMFFIPTKVQASENMTASDANAEKIARVTALTASNCDLSNLPTVEII